MQGKVIWITGLSGSGKTTVAKALLPKIANAILLDGDELRTVLNAENTAFDKEGRENLALTYARLAKLLADQGHIVIVATISLFHKVHEWNRENLPNYLEVFLDVSEDERRRRDPKGLYKAQESGKLENMAGLELQVEFPKNSHIHIKDKQDLEKIIEKILSFL